MPRTTVFEPSRPDEAPETRAFVKVQGICDGLVKRLHISSERYLNKIEVWASSVGAEGLVATTVLETVALLQRGRATARVECERKDEIGNLARSFNSMEERIETLLTAGKRLLQDVSHELRSPLARLSFAAELTKDTPDPEVATSRMRREIERLSQLAATLLEVASAEGDPELLRRAVENVLRNAIQVAPGDSRVSVKVRDEGSNAAVGVRGCGPGAPEDLLARIFGPFFRVDESRDEAGGGTGLGLSIACRAVLLHRGEITAENASPGLRVNLVIPCLQR